MMINCIIATRLFSSRTIFFEVHASNQGQKGPNAGEFDLRNLTEIEEEDPDLLDMDEDEDDNQLILSEEMFDPAYKADTFPLKPRHNRSKYVCLSRCDIQGGIWASTKLSIAEDFGLLNRLV